jgi:hypothetical protein
MFFYITCAECHTSCSYNDMVCFENNVSRACADSTGYHLYYFIDFINFYHLNKIYSKQSNLQCLENLDRQNVLKSL